MEYLLTVNVHIDKLTSKMLFVLFHTLKTTYMYNNQQCCITYHFTMSKTQDRLFWPIQLFSCSKTEELFPVTVETLYTSKELAGHLTFCDFWLHISKQIQLFSNTCNCGSVDLHVFS